MPCCAQVADFGTVRIGVSAGDNSHVSTKVIAGTKGESNEQCPPFSHAPPLLIAHRSRRPWLHRSRPKATCRRSTPRTTSGHVSERTDSFAFGMVLLELLAGRPPRETAALYTMEPGKRGAVRCMCMFTQ
jgi:serine/threonine protein kinase